MNNSNEREEIWEYLRERQDELKDIAESDREAAWVIERILIELD